MLPFIAGAVVGTIVVGAYSVIKNKEAREAVKNKFAEALNSCKICCDSCSDTEEEVKTEAFEYNIEPSEVVKEPIATKKKVSSTKKKPSTKKATTKSESSTKTQKPKKYTDCLDEIRALHKEGKPAVRIAIILKEKYGILVTNSTISKYIRNCKKDGLL
jgi:hypothetical protein